MPTAQHGRDSTEEFLPVGFQRLQSNYNSGRAEMKIKNEEVTEEVEDAVRVRKSEN